MYVLCCVALYCIELMDGMSSRVLVRVDYANCGEGVYRRQTIFDGIYKGKSALRVGDPGCILLFFLFGKVINSSGSVDAKDSNAIHEREFCEYVYGPKDNVCDRNIIVIV